LFCQFHPMRGDDGGAVTGRFSSSDPNLQNIPARTDLGKAIRRIFTYDTDHIAIEKDDMSQQEYRDLAHFAVDNGDGSAERLREEYRNNPKTDYHERTQRMTKELSGMLIERRPIKNMNFGLVYGMQEKKLIRQNGFEPKQGKLIFKAYHEANPYVRATMDAAAVEMQQLGFITTILGRRLRFNLWEPAFRAHGQPRSPGLPFDMAINAYGSAIKRAGEHKAINYMLQGSNADQMKKGMHDCDKAGIFDVIGVPRLTVHDELVFSVAYDNSTVNEAYGEMRHIMETCIPHIKVPVRIDFKRGKSWGDTE
jgi:DNA polymerase I-like protein with 3'-5' exonuclease and polymerase domains